jgi:hypothetical protein
MKRRRHLLLFFSLLLLFLSDTPSRAALSVADLPATVPDVASYAIDVSLDAGAKRLNAHQRVTYVNTTAEPIPDLVFHLYLNAFRSPDSLFMQEGGASHRGYAWDPEHAGWIEVTDLRLADGTPLALEAMEDGTLARAELPVPLAPGETAQIELDFQAQLPHVFARTGYVGDFFMVGQWFPKLGVWEDGAWNAYPFHANAEFYADFGTYDVAITLPSGYVTGATGVPISEVDNGDGTQTLVYRAAGVIDFAWTASPNFRQASRRVDGGQGVPGQSIDVLYLYLPEHEWMVARALDAAEAAVSHYSRWYGPYPYARLTVVDVPDEGEGAGGMEYPMLVTAGPMSTLGVKGSLSRGADRSLEMIVTHEIGHQWWQSVVAFDEAQEPWLDEGFTEYSSMRLMAEVYGADRSAFDSPVFHLSNLDMRRIEYLSNPRVPMYGRAWEIDMVSYVVAAYSKPALSLLTLERTLGSDAMLDLMSTFYQRYRFAHPTTEDFCSVAQEVTGQDLAWFFDGLVYGDDVVNYTVTGLGEHSVTVERQGALRIPTEVLVTFADGSTVLQPWDATETRVTFPYPQRPPVRRAEVDPGRKVVVDLQWADNGLSRRLEVSAWLAVVTRLVYYVQNLLLALGGL